MAIRAIKTTGGIGARGAAGTSAAVEVLAPEVTATHVSVLGVLDAHITVAEFHETINLATTDPAYAAHFKVVEVFFVYSGTTKEILVARFTKPASGTTITVVASSREIPLTASAQTGNTLRFKCYNENFTVSPIPCELTSITLPAAGVTAGSVVGADSTADRWVDKNRSVYAPQTVAVACATYPQIVTFFRYDGTKNNWEGLHPIHASVTLKIGLKGGKEIIFAPPANQTWTMRAAAGTWEGNDTDGWSNLDTGQGPYAIGSIPGIVSSSSYTVVKMALPASGLITAITVAGGIGGAFPYNLVYPDGQQGWSIPYVEVNAAAAFADPNTFTIVMTARDLDASGTPIGIEHVFGTPEVENGVMRFGPLEGPYGSQADPARSGIVAKILISFYCCNRYNDTTAAWADTTNASRAQATTTVTIATTSPYVPTGAIPGPRVSGFVPNASNATSASLVPGSGVFGPSIDLGGGGAILTALNVKSAGGVVIATFGQFGVNYGLYTQNLWVGTNGTGPFGAKLWVDSGGNIRMLGLIESGSSISGAAFIGGSLQIATLNCTVDINSATNGLTARGSGAAFGGYGASGVTVGLPGVTATLSATQLQLQSTATTMLLQNTGIGMIGGGGAGVFLGYLGLVINGTQVFTGLSSQFTGNGVSCPSYQVTANNFSIGPTHAPVIDSARQWVGSHIVVPQGNVNCSSLTIGAGGIIVPGGMAFQGQFAIAIKDGAGNFCHLVGNFVDYGPVRLNIINGIFCGLI
jgi:hypothetical protein